MIELGIIGVANPDFRERYAPILQQLHQKTRVSVIYDPVPRRAEMAAQLFDAEVASSFEKLIRRHHVDAILFLSPGWQGLLPVLSCLELRKPVFCSRAVWQLPHVTAPLERLTQQLDGLIVMENRYRYWPSSLRCRELLASQLGKPQALLMTYACQTGGSVSLELPHIDRAELLDWGRFLLQCSLIRQQTLIHQQTEIDNKHHLEFYRERNGEIKEVIPFTLLEQPSITDDSRKSHLQLELVCEHGDLHLTGSTVLRWRTESAASGQWQEEHLQEQSELLRQFDHFFRRVAGGLIPVHDISDRLWAEQAQRQLFGH